MLQKENIQIAPSILSGDFGHLSDEAKRIEDSGADRLHIDIMDGNFVPNLTLGPRAVAAINRSTEMFLDVHLMVYHPFDYIERFVESGADSITIHLEATEDVDEILDYIRKCNVKAALALCPETTATLAIKYLEKCDMILMMTVHPGFGGQDFIPEVLDKISLIREMCDKLKIRQGGIAAKNSDEGKMSPFDIQVDGGINADTAKQCVKAGANVLVAGSYIFKSQSVMEGVVTLRQAAHEAQKELSEEGEKK